MEGSGVVSFSKEQVVVSKSEEVDYSEAKIVQTESENFEIVDNELLSEIAHNLSVAQRSLESKGRATSRRPAKAEPEDEPSVSGREILNESQNLQVIVKDILKALEHSNTTIDKLKRELADLKQENKDKTEGLQMQVDAANAKATEAVERADDLEYTLESTENSLTELKRVNRVLILENAIAVEQLKRHNVLGVEIPLLNSSDSFLDQHSTKELKIQVTPLDPTSREARVEASPIAKKRTHQEQWTGDSFLTPEISSPKVSTPQSQSKLLERNRRRMLLVDQPPSTPIAIDTSNTSEAVDALMDDLMTRLTMVDLDISYKKLADHQYKIGEKIFHLKNINGRLFTRKGGGYQDLLVVLASFLRF